jgi:hypothetical protein
MAWHHWANRSQQHIATPFIRIILILCHGRKKLMLAHHLIPFETHTEDTIEWHWMSSLEVLAAKACFSFFD